MVGDFMGLLYRKFQDGKGGDDLEWARGRVGEGEKFLDATTPIDLAQGRR